MRKVIGIAVIALGILAFLFHSPDYGVLVGTVGYVIYNPSVLNKLTARKKS